MPRTKTILIVARTRGIGGRPYRRIASEEALSIPEVLEAMQENHAAHPAPLTPTIQATDTFPPDNIKLWMGPLVDLSAGRSTEIDANGPMLDGRRALTSVRLQKQDCTTSRRLA